MQKEYSQRRCRLQISISLPSPSSLYLMSSVPIHLVYIDDDEALLDEGKRFLQKQDLFTVQATSSARTALQILDNSRFDAIVSDYQTGRPEGVEFLKQISARHGNIPLILFTSFNKAEGVADAVAGGISFYVPKKGDIQASFAELGTIVSILVNRARAARIHFDDEERMALALEGTSEAHWDIYPGLGESYLSTQGYIMLGYAPDEIPPDDGIDWRELIHPDDRAMTEAALQEHEAGITEFFQVRHRLLTKTGDWKWILAKGKVAGHDEQGHVIRWVGTLTDISEQKRVEDDLQLARREWEGVFRAIGHPAFVLDTHHSIIDANEAALALTGKSLDEITGMKCWSLFHTPGDGDPPEMCVLDAMLESGRKGTGEMEVRAFQRVFLTSCTPVFDDCGNLIKAILIATDITRMKELEHELTQSRDYLNQIFSSVREGIVIIDAQTHTILDINPAAIRMIGAQMNEILHKSCHQFMCPAEVGKCPITDLHQMVDNTERVLLTADGREIPIIKSVAPFTFQGRECLLETFIDNSERKKNHDDLVAAYQKISEDEERLKVQYSELISLKNSLVESEKKFRTIIETTPDVIWDMTLDGVITYTSPRCVEMLGFQPDELIGRRVADLHPPDKAGEMKDLFSDAKVLKPGYFSIDAPFIRKDGREIIVNIRSTLLYDENGSHSGFRCVARDVTTKVQAMNELIKQKQQIEQLLEQKDLFLNQLAHDLRTPLTPIIGMGPLLQEAITEPDAKELVRIFLTSIDYLKRMVDNVLLNAQLNRTYALDSFNYQDLALLIDDAIEANAFLAEQKQVSLKNEVPAGVNVRVSRPYAAVVFRNLINNAVKYNIPKGTVRVFADVEKGMLKLSIADTGVGIAPEMMGKIWDEMFIGDPARSDPLSKGFGLPIVRKIVMLHNGTIKAMSDGYLKGTTFVIRLPLTREDE